jgi:two-component system sensor histidine kinase YesM
MLERLQVHYSTEKELRDKVYNALLAQSIAEMAAYRNRINPHFLFNTLECIRSMASVYDAEPIEKTVCSLSELFRYSLYSGTVVLLKEELAHVQNYVSVMQQRYPDSVYLRIRTTEKAENETTLSMVLQPLVENSIKHGIKKKNPLIIQIKGDVNPDGKLEIIIADNGPGIPQEKLKDIRQLLSNWRAMENTDPRNHVGLENIYRRLKLLAGDECEFEIKSVEGYYTVVKFRIPSNITRNSMYDFNLKPPFAAD